MEKNQVIILDIDSNNRRLLPTFQDRKQYLVLRKKLHEAAKRLKIPYLQLEHEYEIKNQKLLSLPSLKEPLKHLKKYPKNQLIVFGAGLDFAIESLAAQLLHHGYQMYMPVDALVCINEKNRKTVLTELRALGAEMWNTDFILHHLQQK